MGDAQPSETIRVIAAAGMRRREDAVCAWWRNGMPQTGGILLHDVTVAVYLVPVVPGPHAACCFGAF